MRRLLPTAQSILIHSGQSAALLFVAMFAMAFAPAAPETPSGTEVPYETLASSALTIAFAKPVQGFAINSRFGNRHLAGEGRARPHQGIDIAAPTGTPVLAAAEGEVLRTGNQPAGYGRFIEVRHANGLTSFYGHLSSVDVTDGDRLVAGQQIGRVGSTGYSTGPHLHFEIRRGSAKMNPERYIGREFAIEDAGALLG